ncbi:MAG: pyridoxamine 5'-phosphate oxidase family protein [Myxococcota bacterium]|nr:pyridoxamine 5'-phosphate oxidase family protein [Myxococcota bacterium]
MTDKTDYPKQIRALVETQRFAVLSTRQDDGHPYASLVAYCTSTDLKQLVFSTLRSTRKFANLAAEGRVALLVDNRSNDETDLQKAAAVTILGICTEARGKERTTLSEWFLDKHPAMVEFVRSPGCAVMKVDVRSYYLVTRFQNVIELHIQEGKRCDSNKTPA